MKDDKELVPLDNTASELPAVWGNNAQNVENVRRARQMIQTKHGMLAAVPIICRASACPYFETCWIPVQDLQVGERCPIEIGTIMERFEAYCKELHVDPETEIVDAGLIKEVVDLEVMMVRADGLLAKDASLIEDVVAGVSPKGQEYYRPEIHKAVDLKERFRREKTRILNQLNATRKDKKAEAVILNDPSSRAALAIAKMAELQRSGRIIDITPTEVDDVEPDVRLVEVEETKHVTKEIKKDLEFDTNFEEE